MGREVRCQGVILKGNRILALRQFNDLRQEEYWMLPGGGLENQETIEECIIREVKEETNLDVEIKDILFDTPGTGIDVYKRHVTFLCEVKDGSFEKIGKETDSHRRILELVWCSLEDEENWNEYLLREQFHPSMKCIKRKLIDICEI